MPDEYADHFDPRAYLRQYYTRSQLAADDAELFRALCGWLARSGRTFDTALDFGCGPTAHYAFALAPFVRRIDHADYLPANLAEIRKWLDADPDAHDWDPLFRGVLEIQGDADRLDDRKALYRSRAGRFRHCDLRRPDPLGEPASYDLVVSLFCAECVASSRAEWGEMMGRVLGLVAPGGAVFFATMRNAERYEVLGKWFPSTPVVEADIRELLPRHGFPADRIEVRSAAAPDWAEHGFDHILITAATQPPP